MLRQGSDALISPQGSGNWGARMQSFIEFLIGLMAILITAILSQLGMDPEPRRESPREIHRTSDCSEPAVLSISTANQDC